MLDEGLHTQDWASILPEESDGRVGFVVHVLCATATQLCSCHEIAMADKR